MSELTDAYQLALHHGPLLQGKFSPQKLNFLFVFQVNCPGCFIYGFPVVNRLYHQFGDRIAFLGLSTAFEDFGLNTEENTRKLLEAKTMVGETRRVFEEQQIFTYPQAIDFPVAMDEKAGDSFDWEPSVERICGLNPQYHHRPAAEKARYKKSVGNYLSNLEQVSLTFTLNQLKGTPSLILFDEHYRIRFYHFGHLDTEQWQREILMHLEGN